MKCVIKGVGIIAPGMNDWQQARQVLRGEQPWSGTPLEKLSPTLLPANERRRTTQLIKLALQAAEAAQQHSAIPAAELASVFTSAGGDTYIVDRLCEALALPERPVSPTQFHNSVHNAPAGYWAIAANAQGFSTSISAGAASFATGLMEAMSYVIAEGKPVLLVAYDVALPECLDSFGPCHEDFAAALVLAAQGESGMATIALAEGTAGDSLTLPTGLQSLRDANPAAEALPLLQALAMETEATLSPTYFNDSTLSLVVSACV
jgi:hypothetical protein